MFSRRTPGNLSENPIAKAIARAGQGLLDLTLSNPTQAGFSYPEAEIAEAFQDPQILRYEPDPRGLLPAREALLAHLEK
ncbi:MAG: pyridoxal phosphate-dependent aminotransferase, partial [Bdellovibrionota bacterium]